MHQFTIGIEEEYQIIDVESRNLVSHVSKIIEGGKATLKEHLKNEMHESMVEMETGICRDIQEARAELNDAAPKPDPHGARTKSARVRRRNPPFFQLGKTTRLLRANAT